MRGYQQEKRKGPLACILRGGTHSSFLPGDFHGVTESAATEQLNTFTFTKEKAFPKREKRRREKMAEEGGAPKTHKGSMATGDSIFLSSSSLLVKCDEVFYFANHSESNVRLCKQKPSVNCRHVT
ncbi:unnamed protein product [Rangifer tarandus platyrhynchus]|uniref:Uncharacterized protein n=2 Tax=Rangifer tarandus platyrhynchus TaxID=3082113 RepID=A0AC59ZUQ5_RANTA|nr:unnamed protein product [Rangifer tarandus platyrhynchus]